MSDSELQKQFMELDNLVDHHELSDELQSLDDFLECFLQDLQHSLSDTSDDEASPRGTSKDPFLASSNWSTRQSLFSERWRAERPRLVNTAAAQENVATRICQQCGSNPAAVRCCDCRPRPFFCAECDVSMHTRHVLHNRDAMTAGFYQPLPPTTFVVDKALSHCAIGFLTFNRLARSPQTVFRKVFFEWEAVRYEVDKICKEEHFICPACTPDMLAVSVDGNRKHYRFKNAARSEEQAIFEDIFILRMKM
ncbi:ATP-binding cassette sub-family D member 3 [Labeo rohita]|uniref:ATP-binding cassette sub-family D member 3 n=1 Tax=Labeo rohita TaxID=84645 RepID=A0A498P6Y7_LABRO|nr:ATP-binding cassette sub-family D member 3 [Labeo rohita]